MPANAQRIDELPEAPLPYPPSKTEPWGHQVEFWKKAQGHTGFYAAHSMGCGKSKAAVDYCVGHKANKVLICCPKSVIEVWPKQFRLHAATDYMMIIPPRKPAMTVAKKAEWIEDQIKRAKIIGKPCAVILNYEAMWRKPLGPVYKKNRMIHPGLLRTLGWDVFINDEAHRIKAPGGKASWAAFYIARRSYRKLLLSGTPMPHSPLDIYAQFRVLNPKVFGVNFTRFRARYAIMQACSGAGGAFNKVVDYQNMEELNQKFYEHAHRVEKRDVLDLPDVMHEVRYTELEPKARRAYDEIEKEFVTAVKEGELTVQNALSKMLRLAQITGGTLPLDDSDPIPIGQEKLDVLEDILTDLPESEPVVIFTRFTMELQRIKRLCEKLGRSCAELSGQDNQLADWQNGRFNCLAAQIKSGSEGVDLTRACYTVYLSKGFSLGTYEQSLARTDRPGQTREGLYFHILCRNTVDIREHRALKDRKRVVESVLAEVQIDTPGLMEEALNDVAGYKNLLGT